MRQFLLANRGYVFVYLVLWVGMAMACTAQLYFQHGLNPVISAGDALISMGILFLMLPALWYVIRYSGTDAALTLKGVLNALLAIAFLLTFWFFLSTQVLLSLMGHHPGYEALMHNWHLSRLLNGLAGSLLVYLTMLLLHLRNETRVAAQREQELKTLVQQTELQALKNQLNPHFLYNSLNAISSMITSRPQGAREMIIRLSDFLRYALKQDAMQLTSLGKELESIELYMQIEGVRFGEKLQYGFDVDASHRKMQLPVMILQPLFENAVKHGVQKSDQPVRIQLRSEVSGQTLLLKVTNSMDHPVRFRGEGVGLQNVRNRLRLIYGNGQLLSLSSTNTEFTASLSLPVQTMSYEKI